jgi:hypothetical protein
VGMSVSKKNSLLLNSPHPNPLPEERVAIKATVCDWKGRFGAPKTIVCDWRGSLIPILLT